MRTMRLATAVAVGLLLLTAPLGASGPGDPSTEPYVLGLDDTRAPAHHERFEMVQFVPDPHERFNRGSLAVTKFVVDWVVMPIARGWRFIAPEPLRQGLDNAAYNLGYPVRLVSLWLQAEGRRSLQETGRFLLNTTVGMAGLFDPATDFAIPTTDDDVGIAFARWGWKPSSYFLIPILGPSTGRDTFGRLFDMALTPTTYVPGSGLAFTMNSASFRIDEYEMLRASELDLYVALRALWSVQRQIQLERYEIPAEAFEGSDPEPSLGVLAFTPTDPTFPSLRDEHTVTVPATGGTLPYTVWLQDDPAPVVYLVPGIGAHRDSTLPVGLAELAFARGYSVAIVSSPFHPEFIENALSSKYPGYTPSDAEDLHGVLTAVRDDLEQRHPDQLGPAHLLGYSLGGIEALFIAAAEPTRAADALRFDRYVALNPPVDLQHAATAFDGYFDAPLAWPADERHRRVQEIAMKAFLVAAGEIPDDAPLPFDRTESTFLVGMAGRLAMMATLAALERRGVPTLEPRPSESRGLLLDAVNQAALDRYADELILPYLVAESGGDTDRAAIAYAASLRSQTEAVATDERIRIITNADDFILSEDGLAWLQQTAGARLRVFPTGGHLGNVHVPDVQEAIFAALESNAATLPQTSGSLPPR